LLIGCLFEWLFGWSFHWVFSWLYGWLSGSLFGWLLGYLRGNPAATNLSRTKEKSEVPAYDSTQVTN
jgi:hypothetical protein